MPGPFTARNDPHGLDFMKESMVSMVSMVKSMLKSTVEWVEESMYY